MMRDNEDDEGELVYAGRAVRHSAWPRIITCKARGLNTHDMDKVPKWP